ncbi:MAG: hypothetical protein LLG05_14635 [Porphyromonadaceae bacterium]|nr:hypothetical protein [Porphyromonadaceae bacterium]
MATCNQCGSKIIFLPFKCWRCGALFCVDHRLPELHDCPAMPLWWHNRGKYSKPASQLREIEVICYTPPTHNEEEEQIPCVLTT